MKVGVHFWCRVVTEEAIFETRAPMDTPVPSPTVRRKFVDVRVQIFQEWCCIASAKPITQNCPDDIVRVGLVERDESWMIER
jgi:hypothetical protein